MLRATNTELAFPPPQSARGRGIRVVVGSEIGFCAVRSGGRGRHLCSGAWGKLGPQWADTVCASCYAHRLRSILSLLT